MSDVPKSDVIVWVIAVGINLISTFIVWILKKIKLIPLKKSVPVIFVMVTISFLGLSFYYYHWKGLLYAFLIYLALVEIGLALYLYTDFKFTIRGINSIGIRKTFPIMKAARDKGESEYSIASKVKKSFKFCTISGRSIYSSDFENLLKEKAKGDCNFYFLFFDPASKDFKEKMLAEGSEPENSKIKIETITESLCKLKTKYEINIHIRWYSEYPVWRFIISDDQKAHVGFYPPNKKGYIGPWVIFDDKESSFLHPFSKYFEKLWENAKEIC